MIKLVLINKEYNFKLSLGLYLFILMSSLFTLFGLNTANAATFKEITSTITYPSNDSNGHSLGELFSSDKDGGGNYLNTKALIQVTGEGINGAGNTTCSENVNGGSGLKIVNGSFYYLLGQNPGSCNLDNLKDGETYVINIFVDTNNDGTVQTNGTDFKAIQNYFHRSYYTKPEADDKFIAKNDIVDSSGIVKTSVLPYVKGQIIGTGGLRASCTGTGCDSNYYDVTNLIPKNVKKGITFGANQIGIMTSETGTGIAQIMAGGLCSGAGIKCYMFDYTNDGYLDIVREDKDSSNGKSQLSFFTFFPKGSKFILDQTYALDISPDLVGSPMTKKELRFYSGDQFSDDPKVFYFSTDLRWGNTGRYQLVKITPSNGLISLNTVVSKSLTAMTFIGSSGNPSGGPAQGNVTFKKNTAIGVTVGYFYNDLVYQDESRVQQSTTLKEYFVIKSGVLTNLSSETVSRKYGSSYRNINGSSTENYFLEGFNLPSINITSLKLNYNRHLIYVSGKFNWYAYNVDTGVSTLLNSDNRLNMNINDTINFIPASSLRKTIDVLTGTGEYIFKRETFDYQYTGKGESNTTVYIFKYNPVTKVFNYVSSFNTPTVISWQNSNGISNIGIGTFTDGNVFYNGPSKYSINFTTGVVGFIDNYVYVKNSGYSNQQAINKYDLENGMSIGGGRVNPDIYSQYTKYSLYNNVGGTKYTFNKLLFSYEATQTNGSIPGSIQIFGNIVVIKDGWYASPPDKSVYINGPSFRGRTMTNSSNYKNLVYNAAKDTTIGAGEKSERYLGPVVTNYNLDLNGYNGTGAIFVYGTSLYNAISGDLIIGFTYNVGATYTNTKFNSYRNGNYYILPDQTTGKNFLYEYTPVNKQLVLRSSNVVDWSALGGEALYVNDNGTKYNIAVNDAFALKTTTTGSGTTTIFETGAIHYNGTSTFYFNGVKKDGGIIPQNANERWLGYWYYKLGMDTSTVTFTDYLTQYRNIITTEGSNNILLISPNNYQDIQVGVGINSTVFDSYNSGSVLFSNTAPYYKVTKTNNNYSNFTVYKNKEFVNATNFDFYVRDADRSVKLFTKNSLMLSSQVPGLDAYIITYGYDKEKAISEFKKQSLAFGLNGDFTPTTIGLTIFPIRLNNNSLGGVKTTFESPSYINSVFTQSSIGSPVVKLNNLSFINTPIKMPNSTFLPSNVYSGGFNYTILLDHATAIKKNDYQSNFITGPYSNYYSNGMAFNQCGTTLLRAQLFGVQGGGGCPTSVNYDFGNRVMPLNTVITLADGSSYTYNRLQHWRGRRENYNSINRTAVNINDYAFQNLSNGKFYITPVSTVLNTTGSGITSLSIKYNNRLADYVINSEADFANLYTNTSLSISNYFDISKRSGNSNLYFKSGKLKLVQRELEANFYMMDFTGSLFNENMIYSGADLGTFFKTNGSFLGQLPSYPSWNSAVGNFTVYTAGTLDLAKEEIIPSSNFVTDGLFITKTNLGATNFYKVNGTNVLTLGDSGTVLNKISYMGGTKYLINQNGSTYTNRDIIYNLSGGNLTMLTTLISTITQSSTYNGINWTVKESLYKDISNNYFIQLDNSLYPAGSKTIALLSLPNMTTNLQKNLFSAGGDPYVMDTNNRIFVYNVLQNVLITDLSQFNQSSFQKLSIDNIFIGKTAGFNTYIFDINGNWKTVQSTNGNKLVESIYGGGTYTNLKLGDGYLGIKVNKYSGTNLLSDMVTSINEPFFSLSSGFTTIGTPTFKYYLYNGYLRTFDLTTGELGLLNIANTPGVIKSIKSRENNGIIFLYRFNASAKKIELYSIEDGELKISDIQQSDVEPATVDGSDVITINGLQYTLTAEGLLSIIVTPPAMTPVP